MAAKIRTTPRKSASQQRSRLTVDALVEATARILVRDGFEGASTNKIAQVAGVGIGSLYQYFPNKEALVGAVVDRHSEATMQVVRAALRNVALRSVEEAVAALVRVGIDSHRVNTKLHRVLSEQVPRVGRVENMQAIGRETFALVRGYLESHRAELSVPNVDMAAFICVTTVEALTHAAVVDRPDALSEVEADALVAEVTRLIVGYLKGRPARRRSDGTISTRTQRVRRTQR
jgi:AcrR family transcriptional regulator